MYGLLFHFLLQLFVLHRLSKFVSTLLVDVDVLQCVDVVANNISKDSKIVAMIW